MLIMLASCQISDIINVFSYYPKTCNFTICSIFINIGHAGCCTASPDTIVQLETVVMIHTKFGCNWSSSFRGEDFWKRLRRTTDDTWWQKLTWPKLRCNSTVKIRFGRKKILSYAYMLKNGVGRYNIFFFYFYTKLAESSFLFVCAMCFFFNKQFSTCTKALPNAFTV